MMQGVNNSKFMPCVTCYYALGDSFAEDFRVNCAAAPTFQHGRILSSVFMLDDKADVAGPNGD
jgi:hypothetical protein